VSARILLAGSKEIR